LPGFVLAACTLEPRMVSAQAPTPEQEATTSMLKIQVVEGEGAINNIRLHRAKVPVVRTVDDHNQPLSGVAVTFLLPVMGPGGEFPGNIRELALQTDEKGEAAGNGLVPNQMVGKFQIRVAASYRGERADAVINQTNAEPGGAANGGSSKKILLIAVIGGAVAGGVALAASRGSSSSGGGGSTSPSQPAGPQNPAAIVITSGTPVLQPPH
jgi:hypothetical protein